MQRVLHQLVLSGSASADVLLGRRGLSQYSIHLPPRDTELPRNGGPAVTLSGESQDGLPVDAALAALIDFRLLRLLNALGLPLAAQVRLELGEDAQHVEERLARRRARGDWLLGRLERDALLLQLMHDVLEVTHGASQPVDARDDDGVALVSDLEQEAEPFPPIPLRAGDLLREDEISIEIFCLTSAPGRAYLLPRFSA